MQSQMNSCASAPFEAALCSTATPNGTAASSAATCAALAQGDATPHAPTGSRSLQHLKPVTQCIDGRAMQAQPHQQQQGGGGKGSAPAPAPAPTPAPVPIVESDGDAARQKAEDDIRHRQGALASNVTGPLGAAAPTTSGKTLLGA